MAGLPKPRQSFRADLEEFPRNGWSLFGLAEVLRKQGKVEAASMVQREFENAWEKSDVALRVDWL